METVKIAVKTKINKSEIGGSNGNNIVEEMVNVEEEKNGVDVIEKSKISAIRRGPID